MLPRSAFSVGLDYLTVPRLETSLILSSVYPSNESISDPKIKPSLNASDLVTALAMICSSFFSSSFLGSESIFNASY